MPRKPWLALLPSLSIWLLAACSPRQVAPTPIATLPNPASVHCEQTGGRLELKQDATGGTAGICVFANGSQCDEWAYFRGECKPAGTPSPAGPIASASAPRTPTETAELTADGRRVYRNGDLGYRFAYPADASILVNDEPLRGLSITGANAGWPSFGISHPRDREDFRPPEGVDLEKWLIDHSLWTPNDPNPAADVRQANMQIGGTTAIHIRHNRSPQSFASDRYYFAKSGQLYMIVIGHPGDKEDWILYDRFLKSFTFEG